VEVEMKKYLEWPKKPEVLQTTPKPPKEIKELT
jgi:hypothetical protein